MRTARRVTDDRSQPETVLGDRRSTKLFCGRRGWRAVVRGCGEGASHDRSRRTPLAPSRAVLLSPPRVSLRGQSSRRPKNVHRHSSNWDHDERRGHPRRSSAFTPLATSRALAGPSFRAESVPSSGCILMAGAGEERAVPRLRWYMQPSCCETDTMTANLCAVAGEFATA